MLLKQTAPELARRIESADASRLRLLTAAIVATGVECSGLSHPLIAAALARLASSSVTDQKSKASLEQLTEELDEIYFDLKEPLEEREDGGNKDPQVLEAFRKARAAAAVAAAFDVNARDAAIKAAYEACFTDASAKGEALIKAADRVLGAG